METGAARRYIGYECQDSSGRRLGGLEQVWVDEATGRPEFFGVKSGWLFGRQHIIPATNANIDDNRRTIRTSFTEDKVKAAPDYDFSEKLSDSEEQRLYSHYGVQRSFQRSPTGLPGGAAARPGEERGQAQMALREEELKVGKREVSTGGVRLRKIVREEPRQEEVTLRREEVEIERVPATEARTAQAGRPFQEEDIFIPTSREEPVVQKGTRVTGAVEARKRTETERETVRGTVRREDVEVDRDVDREEKP